jgi:hypothetical protein
MFRSLSPRNAIKERALDRLICPMVVRLGIQTIPAATLLVGEAGLSYFLHYGVILPSPMGVELMEFPTRMTFILEHKKIRDTRLKVFLGFRYLLYLSKRNRL